MAKDRKQEHFGSKLGIIFATAGSALGLGNIYRFPCEAGDNGGGAFLIVYIAIAIIIGVPMMMAEFVVGRRARHNPIGAFRVLGKSSRRSSTHGGAGHSLTLWPAVGVAGLLCAFLVLSFYTTVAGWTLGYLVKSTAGAFNGQNIDQINQQFMDFVNNPWQPIVCQVVFLILTALVVTHGVKKGIERWSKMLMPLLLVIMVVLCIKSLTLDGAADGMSFFFRPDFSEITPTVVLNALGQCFFSLSIGMGALITYGSYIGDDDNLTTSSVSVALMDTLVAIMAGIIIFPAAFTFGVKPEAGPTLVFSTLPALFQEMTGGYIFCLLFFLLLVIATLTSTISLLEVIVATTSEELHWSRRKASIVGAAVTAVLGVMSTISLRSGSGMTLMGKSVFDLLDNVTALYIMPLGGLFTVIFVGWWMKKADVLDELSPRGAETGSGNVRFMRHVSKGIYYIIRYVAPLVILTIFIWQFIRH